jgi:hypothetical protein
MGLVFEKMLALKIAFFPDAEEKTENLSHHHAFCATDFNCK